MPVVLAAPFGLAYAFPIGGPVAGAGKPLRIDEGFKKYGRCVVKALPVLSQRPDVGRQDLRGQVLYAHPGRNKKANVIYDLMQVVFPGGRVPADYSIPAGHFPGGGPPSQTGNGPVVEVGNVLQIGADNPGTGKVVVF